MGEYVRVKGDDRGYCQNDAEAGESHPNCPIRATKPSCLAYKRVGGKQCDIHAEGYGPAPHRTSREKVIILRLHFAGSGIGNCGKGKNIEGKYTPIQKR